MMEARSLPRRPALPPTDGGRSLDVHGTVTQRRPDSLVAGYTYGLVSPMVCGSVRIDEQQPGSDPWPGNALERRGGR